MYEKSIGFAGFYRFHFGQGVTKKCRLSWLTNSALVYEPNAGGGCTVSANEYRCAHGAQINFGDLLYVTPYFTLGAIKALYNTNSILSIYLFSKKQMSCYTKQWLLCSRYSFEHPHDDEFKTVHEGMF